MVPRPDPGGEVTVKKTPLGGRVWINPGMAYQRGEEPQSHENSNQVRTAELQPLQLCAFPDTVSWTERNISWSLEQKKV